MIRGESLRNTTVINLNFEHIHLFMFSRVASTSERTTEGSTRTLLPPKRTKLYWKRHQANIYRCARYLSLKNKLFTRAWQTGYIRYRDGTDLCKKV